ncbi:RNA polymerase subunit sigma-24 [Streptomyces sp. NBC_01190]|uniref:RNA polymerase subunit sigma-24 n=1 Tax=Streptomyces sp. NBC_01190 TaxID=2903767 RepID=UPI00386DB791|nr:RNA polymerase subunit sigma-24 [Streptomyces sp. NBC_01190]
MDGLTIALGCPGGQTYPTGVRSPLDLPVGVTGADAVRLFGAAYRMLGSACGAGEVVRDVLREATGTFPEDGTLGGGAVGDPYRRLVAEVFAAALRRGEPVRPRREPHTVAWLPEPVLTAGGTLGPLDTPERREAVSMARLVLLERLAPGERAAAVVHEMFDYGPAEAATVLGLPEARYVTLERRARHRLQEAETPPRTPEGEEQRWSAVAELLRAIKEEDAVALEELLADDVVAWSDGGGEPGVVRRPVLGTAKVGRFLAAVRERIRDGVRGHIAEVNGDAALIAAAGAEVVGVLAPEFGVQGMVGIRAVADPARLVFVSRQWAELGGSAG